MQRGYKIVLFRDDLAERGKGWAISMPSLSYRWGYQCNSPYINHFISADTIVASYANPQSLNRYSYVTNNPLKYTDPTGHCVETENGTCIRPNINKNGSATDLGLDFSGNWDKKDKKAFMDATSREARRMYAVYCSGHIGCEYSSPAELYQATHGTTTLTFSNSSVKGYFCQRNANAGQEGTICYANSKGKIDSVLAAHELGHVFNALIANNGHTMPYTDMATERSNGNLPDIGIDITSGYNKDAQKSDGEDFANTYSMWVFGEYPNTEGGRQRQDFMDKNMFTWILHLLAPK